jgi:hypothetical protein
MPRFPETGLCSLNPTFRRKFNTVVDRATELVRKGVPKEQLLMQLKTDDIGWAPRIPSIDGLYAELGGR